MGNLLRPEALFCAMKRLAILATVASLSACLPHPPPSAAPYRAVGQSADWTLIVDDRFITFIPGPGQQPLLQPAPKPIIGIAGEIYQTPRINVNIVHATCNDGRTNRAYPDRVQVDVDGRRHNGCGGL
jgi:heat shock protein HslJ